MKRYFQFGFLIFVISLSLVYGNQTLVSADVHQNELVFQNINLSTDKSLYSYQVEPSLAIDGDNVFVGFKNAFTHDGGGVAVSYTYSSDSLTWSSPSYMEQFYAGSGQSDPWMATFNHTLYYVFLEYPTKEEGQSQITLARTNDLGANWDLTRATYGAGFADKETFTIDENGYIYVAYDDIYTGNEADLFHTDQKLSRSFDGGDTFVENVTMNDQFLDGYLAPYVVSAGSGLLYNVFSYIGATTDQSDIFFDKSINYGETWGIDTDLNPSYNASTFTVSTESQRPTKSTIPSMCVDDNGVVYVVWADISEHIASQNWDVYMRYSTDKGKSWSDRIRINEHVEGDSWMPDVDADSAGNIYISYYDNNLDGNSNLLYREYYPDNESLSTETRISRKGTSPDYTRLGDYQTIRLDDDDKFHVVWTDGREGLLNIYYATNKLDKVEISISNTVSDSTSKDSKSPFQVFGFSLAIAAIIMDKKRRRNFNE